MSDEVKTAAFVAPAGRSAGAILREARQAQGVHIAALAASMKVTQKKLEALEADRVDELPDATFARALAQTVCRTLKIDAAPVLALLPQQQFTGRLEHVSEGINEPFRDHGGRQGDGDWSRRLRSPIVWVPLLLLIAAAALFLAPQGLMLRLLPASGAASGAGEPSASSTVVTPVDSAASDGAAAVPPQASASAPSAMVAATAFAASMADAAASTVSRVAAAASVEAASLAGIGAGGVQLHAKQETWVEVQDARPMILIGRALKTGETVTLEGTPPFRVKIGNAIGTELTYRGRGVDLAPSTRDNVARLELK